MGQRLPSVAGPRACRQRGSAVGRCRLGAGRRRTHDSLEFNTPTSAAIVFAAVVLLVLERAPIGRRATAPIRYRRTTNLSLLLLGSVSISAF